MKKLMRCQYCGLLQDEPAGVKTCTRCGGELAYEDKQPAGTGPAYLQVQMELDQVAAPAGQNTERYLMVTVRAPATVPDGEAAPQGKTRSPINFASVLDVSGSMNGGKLSQAKQALRMALRTLRNGDIFSLATFSSSVACPFKPASLKDGMAEEVETALQEIHSSGMTALCGGLDMGIANALKKKMDTSLVLLLSDGQANVGETDLEKVGQHALHARQQGLIVSTLGVGSDYDEALMTEIATQGGGRAYHIQNASSIPAFVAGELGEVANLAARQTRLVLSIPAGATLVPLSAAYPVRQEGDQAEVSLGDIPCDTELEIPLRLALLPQKTGSKLSVEGSLDFNSPAGHAIRLPVNRVTIRFISKAAFSVRAGVVQPVAERVFVQLKASSVLSVSRFRVVKPGEADKKVKEDLDELRTYAEKLGEGRAQKEFDLAHDDFLYYASSPMAAKSAVMNANRTQRSIKDFDNK